MNPLLKAALVITVSAALWQAGLQQAEAQQPLYNNSPPGKQKLPLTSSVIDLTNAPPASSVEDANNRFSARAAAAIYQAATAELKDLPVNSDDYGVAILSKWAYQEYFDIDPADRHRSDTIQSLLGQQAGRTGTDGDYDFLLNLYVPLLYKYYNDLEPVREHIINQLLNLRGPLTPHESEHIFNRTFGVFIPETENHLFLIETARYLTNQLLYQRTHDPQFDNRRNGGDDLQATTVWLLDALQGILQHDFLEYNGKSYQDQIMKALLNLASYAYDDDVRLAARMALDYISAKIAVSSNDLRRAPPFRRRNEELNWGPVVSKGFFLRSPLLKSKSYPDAPNPNLVYSPDPQGAWYAMLAGNTALLDNSAFGNHQGPGNFGLAMVVAGLHDYRIPAPILDLFVKPIHRRFYQRFHHEHVIHDVEAHDSADELYAGSPSYLITAGGHPADFAYRALGLGTDFGGSTTDLGLAMPTTFMPTDSNLTLDHMVQFGSRADNATNDDPIKHHMCVAPDFACGCRIFLPEEIDPDQHPNDENIRSDGNWTFINRGTDGTKAGYFLAVYRVDNGNNGKCGFLEAYDTWLHPGSFTPLSFENFQQAIKATNPAVDLQFGDQVNTYVTFSGQQVKFTISPHSDIVSTSDEPEPVGYKDKFTHGTILDSGQGSGIVVIRNPALGSQITLNMKDKLRPERISELGDVERAGFDVHQEVWVDFNSPLFVPSGPDGDFYHPFKTLAEAQHVVAVGGTIKIVPGLQKGPMLLNTPMTLKSFPGSAIIGRQ